MAEEKKKSLIIQEMERRANDLIRVYNPTDQDYVVKWDKKNGTKLFRVPKKSETVLVRYIAEKYIHEMYDILLTSKADMAVINENERRIEKGLAEMNKFNEQFRFESKFYVVSEEDARKVIATLYVGIEREFGVDSEVQEEEVLTEHSKPIFSRALESIQSGKPAEPSEETMIRPLKTEFKCDYPGCDFTATANIALLGHKRSHRVDEKKTEAVRGIT
jgi:hypothetical protein